MLAGMERAAERMEASFLQAKEYSHRGLTGDKRERAVVAEWLEPYLPKRYGIHKQCQIVDADGNFSTEQDIVIYDDFLSPPLMPDDDAGLLFREGVFCVIEVTSLLDGKGIKDAFVKVGSVASMIVTTNDVPLSVFPGLSLTGGSIPLLGSAIAYRSPFSIDEPRQRAQEESERRLRIDCPSCLAVLEDKNGDSGLIVSLEPENFSVVVTTPSEGSRYAVARRDTKGKVLLDFFLLLMTHLRTVGFLNVGPDFRAYSEKAGLGSFLLSMPTAELEGMTRAVPGVGLSGTELKALIERHKRISHGTATEQDVRESTHASLIMAVASMSPSASIKVDGQDALLPPVGRLLGAFQAIASGEEDAEAVVLVNRVLETYSDAMRSGKKIEIS